MRTSMGIGRWLAPWHRYANRRRSAWWPSPWATVWVLLSRRRWWWRSAPPMATGFWARSSKASCIPQATQPPRGSKASLSSQRLPRQARYGSRLRPTDRSGALRPGDDACVGQADEQAVLDDADRSLHRIAEARGIFDAAFQHQVEDQVAVVRDIWTLFPTSDGQAHAQRGQPFRRGTPQERQHLHREHADTKLLDQLRVVDHDDESLRRRRDQLLAEQRASAPLDQVELWIHLVGSINGEVDLADKLLDDRDSVFGGQLGSGARGGHAPQGHAFREQTADTLGEVPRRRAAAQAEQHSVLHELQRLFGGGPFEFLRQRLVVWP